MSKPNSYTGSKKIFRKWNCFACQVWFAYVNYSVYHLGLEWPREYRSPKPWSRASSDACFMKTWRRASNDACFAELWRRASSDACFVKRWCRASSEACFTEAVLPSLRWSLLDEAGFISAKVGSGRTTGHTRFKALFFLAARHYSRTSLILFTLRGHRTNLLVAG